MEEFDTYYSCLPLAHTIEILSVVRTLLVGGRIGFFSGDIGRIMDDL